MKWGGCVCNGRHWDVSNDTEISRREKSRARHRGMRTAEQRRTGLLTTTIQQAILSASAKRNRNNKAEHTCHLAIRYLSTNRHKGRGQSESCCCGARAHAAGSISRGRGTKRKTVCWSSLPPPESRGCSYPLTSQGPVVSDRRCPGVNLQLRPTGSSSLRCVRATREYLTGPKLIYVCGHEFTWCVFCGDK